MAQYDGSVKFDTKLDTSSLQSGLTKLKTMATASFAAIAAAGTVAIKKCVDAGASFESTMSKVSAISGASAQDMEKLTAKAREMGASTVFSATESADALTYMAMAGWKTEDMLSGIEGIMNLAASAGEDLATTSDIVTDALTAFGLSAADSGHFADVLAIASSNANTNVSMMGATFKYAAPLAGALGYSIEDVAVATGLMANAGIKGEQAGTALRSTFTRLADPPKEAAEALDALGISIKNTDGTAKPLNVTIGELRSAFANLTETEKTTYASQISGQMAMSGLLAIVNASEADFNKLTKAVESADGAAKKMADTMVDNLKGDLKLMESALEGLGIAVYDNFEKPLRKAVQGASGLFSELSESVTSGELQPKMEKLGESLGGFVEDLVGFATNSLPVVIDALTLLVDNLDIVTAAMIGMAQVKLLQKAMTAYQVMLGMSTAKVIEYTAALEFEQASEMKGITVSQLVLQSMTLKDLLVGVLTGKIKLATAAQHLWNAAMNSNPIGLLITALGMLIPLIGVGFSRATKDACNSTEELGEAVRDLNSEYDSAIKSAESHKAEMVANAEKAEILKDRIFELDDALSDDTSSTDDNTHNKEKLRDAVADLCDIIPDLKIEIDEETGKLKTERGEVEKLTQAYKDLMIAKAYQNYYQDTLNAAVEKKVGYDAEIEKAQDKLDSMPKGTVSEVFVRSDRKDPTQGTTVKIKSSERYAYEEQESKLKALKGMAAKSQEEIDNTLDKMTEWRLKEEELTDAKLDPDLNSDTNTVPDTTRTTTRTYSAEETPAEKELRNLRFAYEMGEKSAVEFYKDLTAYRDKYFTEGSEDWQDLTLEIKEGYDKFSEEQKEQFEKNLEEAIEKERNALDRKLERGEMSEAEYYYALGILRDKYFAIGTEEYEAYTDEILDYQKRAHEEQINDEFEALDRMLRRREITEQEYYDKLGRIRDKYYTETDEKYQKLTDEIIEHNNRLADETTETVKTTIQDTFSDISEYADTALGEIENKIESMHQKIASFGSLTETDESGNTILADLHKANETLFEYQQYLSMVEKRAVMHGFDEGTADGLFSALSEMSVDDALKAAKLLYDASDYEFRKYIMEFEKKQTFADKISDSFYKDDYQKAVDNTVEYMKGKFEELGVDIPEEFFAAGTDSAKSFGDAFLNEIDLQMKTIQSRIDGFNLSMGLGFGTAISGLFGMFNGGITYNYDNTYNITNPQGTVTSAKEEAEKAATVDRMTNG